MTAKRVAFAVMSDSVWKLVSRFAAIVSPLAIIALAVKAGAWMESVEGRLAHNEAADLQHHMDDRVHMSFEEKVENFVTRREWEAALSSRDQQLGDIKESARRTEERVEKIYDLLRQQ